MYYEERVVDGVLCWRGTKNSPWIPLTSKELTRKLIDSKVIREDAYERI